MKAVTYLFYVAIIAGSSLANAETIDHQHGDRSHSHKLPSNGVKHSHGDLPLGSFNNNEQTTVKETPHPTAGRKKPYTVKSLNEIKGNDRKIDVKFSCGNSMLPEEINVTKDTITIRKKRGCITSNDVKKVENQNINSLVARKKWSRDYARDIGRGTMRLYLYNSAFVALAMTARKDQKHKKLYEEFVHKMTWENIVFANNFLQKKLNLDETNEMQVDVDTIEAILNLH